MRGTRLVDLLFDLRGERVVFRTPTVESLAMIGATVIPLGLAIFYTFFVPTAQAYQEREWLFFLFAALAVPLLAYFWGPAPGITAIFFAAGPLLFWLLINYNDQGNLVKIPLVGIGIVTLFVTAHRIGDRRRTLDGRLAARKMLNDDLDSQRNLLTADLQETQRRITNHHHLTRQITRLTATVSEFERSLSLARVAETIAARVHEILGRGRTLLYKFDGDTSHLLSAFPSCDDQEDFGDDYNPIIRRRRENIMIADTARQYQIFPVAPPRRAFRSCLIVPLATSYEAWGVLRIESDRAADFSREDLQALVALSVPATLALQNADLFAEIERRAVTDGLTGLFRRHHFDSQLDIELARAKRGKTRLTLLFFDVDHFKAVNDTYGHAQGDIILRETAMLLGAGAPEGSITARYGGEEFVVILPETEKAEGVLIAEAIRSRMESHAFTGAVNRVTISGGVAEYPADGETSTALTESADAALYRSKRDGRNRITAT